MPMIASMGLILIKLLMDSFILENVDVSSLEILAYPVPPQPEGTIVRRRQEIHPRNTLMYSAQATWNPIFTDNRD
jgi:hypothetical protein